MPWTIDTLCDPAQLHDLLLHLGEAGLMRCNIDGRAYRVVPCGVNVTDYPSLSAFLRGFNYYDSHLAGCHVFSSCIPIEKFKMLPTA